jgi:hypothetical protein
MSGTLFMLADEFIGPFSIPAGSDTSIAILFDPESTIIHHDTLLITELAGDTLILPLEGQGIQEGIALSSTDLDFGPVRTGTTDPRIVTVFNTGTAPLTVFDVVSSDPAFTVELVDPALVLRKNGGMTQFRKDPHARSRSGNLDEITFTIDAAESRDLSVMFSPVEEIEYIGTLTIISTLPDEQVALSGLGAAPHLTADPTSVDFGSVSIDSSEVRTILLSNVGQWPLTLLELGFVLGNAYEITQSPELPFELVPSAQEPIEVRFQPSSETFFFDALLVTHDSGLPLEVGLAGIGLAAGISVQPSSISFGSVWIGDSSIDSILVGNPGSAWLILDSVYCHDEGFAFTIVGPLILPPDSFLYVTSPFLPVDTLDYAGEIIVTGNAGERTVDVTGQGAWTALAAQPEFIVFPPIVYAHDPDTAVVTLSSIGNYHVASIAASMALGEYFQIVSAPADSIGPYESTTVRLTSSSDSVGVFLDTLLITDNIAGLLRIPLVQEVVSTAGRVAGVPDQLYLNQNYPNPFNPSTTLEFGLPRITHVDLRVYDLLGRTITSLVSGTMTAGSHTITWSCPECASGIYLIRLSTPEAAIIRKAMLLK